MHAQPPLTAVVTCFNSAATLEQCLGSLRFCDELVVLDSGSTDASQAIARRHGARWHVEPFRGYAAQKQAAIDRAGHDWVLLLDSDEWLAPGAAPLICEAVASGRCVGYSLRRREWLFWRWQHPRSRHNRYVRLFDRRRAWLSTHAVHETVRCDGPVASLPVLLMHRGDVDLAGKIDKANRYSSLQQADIAPGSASRTATAHVALPGGGVRSLLPPARPLARGVGGLYGRLGACVLCVRQIRQGL